MRAVLLFILLTGVSAAAAAQPAIAGLVMDTSGAPLPGVLVTASSPALIEQSRTVATDASGRYRVADLRPGIYVVRFALTGAKSQERPDIELTGSFTATVDATLSVGSFGEAVTVRGEVPVVDVFNATREVTLTRDVVTSIPTARTYNALLVLVPGVVTNTNDTVTGTTTTQFPIHGGRTAEGRLAVDGLTIGSPPNGNSPTNYFLDAGTAEEVTFSLAGASGEAETSGLVINIVPRPGANTTAGSLFVSGTGEALQGDNLTLSQQAQGLVATPLMKVYDVSASVGGAIVRDRLWYYTSGHIGGSTRQSANIYYNENAGDPAQWLYAPDLNRHSYSDRTFESLTGRVTWQVARANKVSAYWEGQSICRSCTGATGALSDPAQVSPEAVGVFGRPLRVAQATWSNVRTHWLLEAGFGGVSFGWSNFERDPNPTRNLIRVVEQCASGCAANGSIPGLVYRSQDFSENYAGSYLWKGSAAYVSGTHNLKIGYQHTFMTDDRKWMTNDANLTYRFSNGVPNQLTESIAPWVNTSRLAADAVFVQDQWTLRRITLQGALRFDRAASWFPTQRLGPSRFMPTAIVVPETRGVDSYKDLSPRLGAAYDLFGTGNTALRFSLAKFVEGAGLAGNYLATNPTLRMPSTTPALGPAGVTRSWIDANANFAPDCDLLNPAAQDLRASGGDACGVVSNTQFGQNVLTNNFAAGTLDGWGVRPSDWNLTATLEQRILPRSSVSVSYTRRWFRGFFVADNVALSVSDLTPFSIVAPVDRRLPDGGGYVVSGLYDVVPDKAGQVDNLIADSRDFGNWSQHFDGLDVTLNVRSRRVTAVGGMSTGQTVTNNCAVRAAVPELTTASAGTTAFGPGLIGSVVSPASPYCDVAFGLLTQWRGLASYLLPWDVQAAVTIQSRPGPMLAANYAVPNAAVVSSLGRSLSGGASSVTVNVVAPGTMYGDRINQLDARLSKSLTVRGTRTVVAVEVYNTLNSSAPLSYNSTFVPGGTWLTPTAILSPRFLKFTAEIRF